MRKDRHMYKLFNRRTSDNFKLYLLENRKVDFFTTNNGFTSGFSQKSAVN